MSATPPKMTARQRRHKYGGARKSRKTINPGVWRRQHKEDAK